MLAALVTTYVAVMSFGGCADKLLLHPSTDPADAGRATARFIEVDDRRVEIYIARSPAAADREPEGFVLEFCGNATRAEHITQFVADRWKNHPVEVWVMNYPGFGRSDGPARLGAIPRAALATYDDLKRIAGTRPIFLAGNSMGANPALHVASQRPCAGVILQNVPPLRRLILGRHGWWNLWLVALPVAMQVPVELNALDTAPRVTAPAVFIIGEQDTLVPPAYQRLIVGAYGGPKQVISVPGIGHWQSLPPEAEKELERAIDRLWQGKQRLEAGKKKPQRLVPPGRISGETGIRTPDTGLTPYNGLANRRLQPLGHLSGESSTATSWYRPLRSRSNSVGDEGLTQAPPTRRPDPRRGRRRAASARRRAVADPSGRSPRCAARSPNSSYR